MTVRPTLSIALTPCPNDTFVIGAVATGQLGLADADIALELHDIETLNRAAIERRYDVVKVSGATYERIAADYELLDTGAALADGYGPMVLAREALDRDDLREAKVVAPGANTTAALLFELWSNPRAPLAFAPYDQIIDRVVAGEFDAGVIIHESRFTYDQAGLVAVADLGAWWREDTGRPLALGCYVIRRRLGGRFAAAVDDMLREAIRLAEAGNPRIEAYIRRHAQEMDDDVIRRHIALYVNDYTRHLGEVGREAIRYLAERMRERRVAS